MNTRKNEYRMKINYIQTSWIKLERGGGSCSSVGTREVAGSNPLLPLPHVKAFLSKILNPTLLLMGSWDLCHQSMNVCECDKCCKKH